MFGRWLFGVVPEATPREWPEEPHTSATHLGARAGMISNRCETCKAWIRDAYGHTAEEIDRAVALTGRIGDMTRPGEVKFPRPNPAINSTECKDGSQRDPDESLSQPCHVCGHIGCRIGPDGPLLCEVCNIVVYMRALFARTNTLENRADNGQNAIAGINTELADHETRLTNGATSIANQGGRLTTAEGTITTHTTQIAARATNANLTAVDNKVNTLKTRVDNATAFPIP